MLHVTKNTLCTLRLHLEYELPPSFEFRNHLGTKNDSTKVNALIQYLLLERHLQG